MAPSGSRFPVLKPCCLKPGYYFQCCRRYQTSDGIFYDYYLVSPLGRRMKLQPKGPRKLLSHNFQLRDGSGKKRLHIHRVFAFNCRVPCSPRGHSWSEILHVHHLPSPRSCPWSNCTKNNLLLMTAWAHKKWHRDNPGVAH